MSCETRISSGVRVQRKSALALSGKTEKMGKMNVSPGQQDLEAIELVEVCDSGSCHEND